MTKQRDQKPIWKGKGQKPSNLKKVMKKKSRVLCKNCGKELDKYTGVCPDECVVIETEL